MFSRITLLLLSLFVCRSCQNNLQQNETVIRGVLAKNGMVASAHPLASEIGVEVLKKGGNAIDAAIAVHYALAVVYPLAGNIGGGGFMVIRLKDGKTNALDFREKAPLHAYRDMYLDSDGNIIPGLSLNSHLAAGVPGSVDGMFKAHEKYGTIDFRELIQPAIDLAKLGFPLTEGGAKELNEFQQVFIGANPENNYFIKEEGWQAGDTLKQPDLARTLKLIRDQGRAGFYKGITAENIVEEMKRGGGMISAEDLENYQSIWREPITGTYKNYKILSMPPPSSGGIALVQLLKMVEDYPLAAWGWNTTKTVHLMTEAERRVYADRAEHLGDSDFFDVPVGGLLDKDYLQARFKDFDPETASKSKNISYGHPRQYESEETTHFSLVDRFGNAVAVTTTLNAAFGSKIFVTGSGFLLNNEMDDFSAKPGVPNLYGLIGAEANAIEPGKRMLSSMTPTIVEKDGQLFMAVGTPGGSTIITSVFQTILNVVEFDMSMQAAVDAPRFHHQWLPDKIFMERSAVDSTTQSGLRKMGYALQTRKSIGRVDAVLVLENGILEGAADSRGEDKAMGF